MKHGKMELTHACGCAWTSMYPIGTTKRELKQRRENAAKSPCPKCDGKKQ